MGVQRGTSYRPRLSVRNSSRSLSSWGAGRCTSAGTPTTSHPLHVSSRLVLAHVGVHHDRSLLRGAELSLNTVLPHHMPMGAGLYLLECPTGQSPQDGSTRCPSAARVRRNCGALTDFGASPTIRRRPDTIADGTTPVTDGRSGDDNILVEYGDMRLDLGLRARVHALAERIATEAPAGLIDRTAGIRPPARRLSVTCSASAATRQGARGTSSSSGA